MTMNGLAIFLCEFVGMCIVFMDIITVIRNCIVLYCVVNILVYLYSILMNETRKEDNLAF